MQPLAAAESAQFYGTIAVGRQVTAPPQLYTRRMAVGRHRHTPIAVTVKGSRALVKVYTDVNLRVEQANACYGMGLEPVIAMVTYSLSYLCVHACACCYLGWLCAFQVHINCWRDQEEQQEKAPYGESDSMKITGSGNKTLSGVRGLVADPVIFTESDCAYNAFLVVSHHTTQRRLRISNTLVV